jgi:hypothetical protein
MVKGNLTTPREYLSASGFFFNAPTMFTYLVQKSDALNHPDLERHPSKARRVRTEGRGANTPDNSLIASNCACPRIC